MYIAIARFPAVPAERDSDFRDWFTWSNEQLRGTSGLQTRRLLRAEDGSYTAMVEHESASTLTAMHSTESLSRIHERLGQILTDGPQATRYEVVVDSSTSGSCCGGSQSAGHQDSAAQAQPAGRCCQGA